MNERIKELAIQAEIYAGELIDEGADYDQYPRYYTEKFAELIVRECVGVVEGGRFLHDQAPTALFAKECSSAIKRHFGVTE